MVNKAGAGIRVEVLYARPGAIWRRSIELPDGATVAQALEASALLQFFPEFAATPPMVGIFGRQCALQQALQPGDRVEVYRPLVFDPMESRRRRAQHRERKRAAKLS